MNICLIGDGLTNLCLAKTLVDKNIKVSLYYSPKNRILSNNRTIGISKNNYDFLQKKIIQLDKLSWPVNYIKIFSNQNRESNLLKFGDKNKKLFYLIENKKLYKKIDNILKLKKNFKKLKIKNKFFYKNIMEKNNFNIVINSEKNNLISKKIFYKKILKNYKSTAFTTIIKHKKCTNNIAYQIFTNFGPLAFLPLSNSKTSIVYSAYDNSHLNEKKVKNLIVKFNKFFKIKSFSNFEKFSLKLSLDRIFFYKNILSFGDNLHSIHPLAGQGFNMTLRDIKYFLEIVEDKLNLGLPLDSIILNEFKSKTKHLNYIFSSGIDFIYNFFKYDSNKNYSNKIFSILKKDKLFKKYAIKIADQGF
tara:strand:+ start:372 stop:1451 length:1080 start_codon:yes stop_codon:yes gene_type:complete